jgi:hypothetical protein
LRGLVSSSRNYAPKDVVSGRKKASAMEVDRVTQMGGVGRHEVVAWPRAGVRRRKFVEDVEDLNGEDLEGSVEAAGEEEMEEGHDGALDVMA